MLGNAKVTQAVISSGTITKKIERKRTHQRAQWKTDLVEKQKFVEQLSVDVLLTHKFHHFDRNKIDKKRSPYNIERCSTEITNAVFHAQRNVALHNTPQGNGVTILLKKSRFIPVEQELAVFTPTLFIGIIRFGNPKPPCRPAKILF